MPDIFKTEADNLPQRRRSRTTTWASVFSTKRLISSFLSPFAFLGFAQHGSTVHIPIAGVDIVTTFQWRGLHFGRTETRWRRHEKRIGRQVNGTIPKVQKLEPPCDVLGFSIRSGFVRHGYNRKDYDVAGSPPRCPLNVIDHSHALLRRSWYVTFPLHLPSKPPVFHLYCQTQEQAA